MVLRYLHQHYRWNGMVVPRCRSLGVDISDTDHCVELGTKIYGSEISGALMPSSCSHLSLVTLPHTHPCVAAHHWPCSLSPPLLVAFAPIYAMSASCKPSARLLRLMLAWVAVPVYQCQHIRPRCLPARPWACLRPTSTYMSSLVWSSPVPSASAHAA